MDDEPQTRAAEAGRRQFPGIRLADPVFRAHVDRLAVRPEDLGAHGGEIFLAAACLHGDAAALAHFERTHVSAVGRHVTGLALTAVQLEELRQELRVRLLSGSRPGLASYSGRAPLWAWLRVVALRAGMELLERDEHGRAAHDSDEALERVVASYAGPEIHAARADIGPAFRQALEEGFAALTPQEKTILRLHFVDHHNIETIGRIFQVHRATVARWLVTIRAQLFEHVRRRLSLNLDRSSAEVRSVFRLLRSNLQVSVERLLADK